MNTIATAETNAKPKTDLTGWNPEDEASWNAGAKSIAFKNLWVSVPCLLCGFAVWMYWGVITVQMLNLGFPYSKEQLFTLMSIAGLSGATLRIPSTFLIRMAGGRNTIFFTTMLLILPALPCLIKLHRYGSFKPWHCFLVLVAETLLRLCRISASSSPRKCKVCLWA